MDVLRSSYCDASVRKITPQITGKLRQLKIWGFHGSDYEECRLLGYKNTVRTSRETHYTSATGSSQLMLCKIWGFHGGDYKECRLLGYKDPVRTSQETLYVSVTELRRLMLCKIWGFHGGDYEDCRLLGCDAVWLLLEAKFRRNVSPSNIRVTRIGEVGRTLAATSSLILSNLMMGR
jgi:hypothetical protein